MLRERPKPRADNVNPDLSKSLGRFRHPFAFSSYLCSLFPQTRRSSLRDSHERGSRKTTSRATVLAKSPAQIARESCFKKSQNEELVKTCREIFCWWRSVLPRLGVLATDSQGSREAIEDKEIPKGRGPPAQQGGTQPRMHGHGESRPGCVRRLLVDSDEQPQPAVPPRSDHEGPANCHGMPSRIPPA